MILSDWCGEQTVQSRLEIGYDCFMVYSLLGVVGRLFSEGWRLVYDCFMVYSLSSLYVKQSVTNSEVWRLVYDCFIGYSRLLGVYGRQTVKA